MPKSSAPSLPSDPLPPHHQAQTRTSPEHLLQTTDPKCAYVIQLPSPRGQYPAFNSGPKLADGKFQKQIVTSKLHGVLSLIRSQAAPAHPA